MTFGIFTAGDVTSDATTGSNPTEGERIERAADELAPLVRPAAAFTAVGPDPVPAVNQAQEADGEVVSVARLLDADHNQEDKYGSRDL